MGRVEKQQQEEEWEIGKGGIIEGERGEMGREGKKQEEEER